MPTITFTKDTWPESTEEFRRILREAWEKSRPMDDFVEVVKSLAVTERKYNMGSAEFYERYQRGEMGDDVEVMHWASDYEVYREMNAPHFPDLPGFPDHKHTPQGVEPAGPPDLGDVLREVDGYLYPAG